MMQVEGSAGDHTVVVTDIRMPFGSMVGFMVKWTLASIPAFIILTFIGAILGVAVTAMFGGLLSGLSH